jgi:hypothetical protein
MQHITQQQMQKERHSQEKMEAEALREYLYQSNETTLYGAIISADKSTHL